MNYELCKKLKDAGFSQAERKGIGHGDEFIQEGDDLVYCPTLEELIEACGEPLSLVSWKTKHDLLWIAVKGTPVNNKEFSIIKDSMSGCTPSEAVANLWIALHEKKKEV